MANSRYIRLQDLVFDSFLFDCPVEIEKGALLLDNETKAVLLQLRLNIIDINSREISSVTLKIDALDDAGDEIQDIKPFNSTFRDINLLGTNSFGEQTPVVLDPRVRRVKVGLEKVIFLDGNVWRYAGGEIKPPKQQLINSLRTDLLEQLNRDILFLPPRSRERIIYIPQQLDKYWLCACGRLNEKSMVACCRCGIIKKWIFENLSGGNIQKNLDRYKEKVHQEEEQKVRLAKRRSWLRNASLLVIDIALAIVVFFYLGLPLIKYTQALNLLSKKEYDNAISLLIPLGNYRNSKEMINEAYYQKANDFLSNKQFDAAMTIFSTLGNYKNSEELIKEANYQRANDLLSKKQYDEAIANFTNLADYKNSKDMINEANYQRANDFLSNKQYDEAITVFTSLVDYKNSKEMLNEARYEKAKDLFADNLYVESIEIFNDIQEYKDSKDLLLEACYQEAIVSINSEQYSSAIYYLTKIKGYKDSNDLINKVNYMWGKQLVELSDWKNAVGLLTQVQQQIYPDAKELLNKAYYMWGKQLVEVYDWKDAVDVFTKIQQPYSDSDVLLKNAKYELAKEKASSGDYMAAYYLVENLNYKDSAKLAEDYAKIAFAWHITGSMTKSSYSRSEKFTVNITVSGGRPDATISVLVVCTTPDWTVSNVLSKLKNGDGYQVYFFNQNPPYASTGSGIITIKNYSTGEVLATFTFSIYY